MSKEALCNIPALKTLDISVGVGQIVVGVDAIFGGWRAIMQHEDKNKDRHPCHYRCRLCNQAEKRYDVGNCECCGLMKALEKFRNYVYGVRFLVETDATTSVHQLNLPAIDLPEAPDTQCISWIRLFDFKVKHDPGRLNGGADGLSWRLRGEGEPEPVEEDNLEETIEASLCGIWVERRPEGKWRGWAYEPFVGVRLAEECKGRWKKIGVFLGNLKWP